MADVLRSAQLSILVFSKSQSPIRSFFAIPFVFYNHGLKPRHYSRASCPGAKIKSGKAKSKPVMTVTSADSFRSSVPSSSQALERGDPTAVVTLSPGSASVPSQGELDVEASRPGCDCHGGSAAREEGRSPSGEQASADGQSGDTVSAPVLGNGNGVSAPTPSPQVGAAHTLAPPSGGTQRPALSGPKWPMGLGHGVFAASRVLPTGTSGTFVPTTPPWCSPGLAYRRFGGLGSPPTFLAIPMGSGQCSGSPSPRDSLS